MINISISESVIFIADISVIGISVYLLIGAPLVNPLTRIAHKSGVDPR